jgi:DNA-binding transcriptional ArsR family regulator
MMEKEIRSKILEALKDNPQGLTISDLSRITSLSRLTVSKYMSGLTAENKVELRSVGPSKLCCLKAVYA